MEGRAVLKGARLALLPLFIFFLSVSSTIAHAGQPLLTFDESIALKLPAYGTVVRFANDYSFSKLEWDSLDASRVAFHDFSMAPYPRVGYWSVSVEGANLTVARLEFYRVLEFVVEAPSGTVSELQIHSPSEPRAVRHDGVPALRIVSKEGFSTYVGNAWHYDPAAKLLSVRTLHSSPVVVEVNYLVGVAPPPPPPPPVEREPEPIEQAAEAVRIVVGVEEVRLALAGVAIAIVAYLIRRR